jgi:L-lactate dehydrogenase complex protein LldE
MAKPIHASLLVTCLVDLFYPDVGVAAVRLLRRHGVTVHLPRNQTCCGLPLFNSGYHREAARVARRTISLFQGAEHVVVPSGSCAWMVKKEYPGLFQGEPALKTEAEALAARTHELSQFLVKVLGVARPTSDFRGKVAYHDSCHLLRGLGESDSPRTLLGHLNGVELVGLPGADECCGFGGSFSVRLPEISTSILRKKIANVQESGAECLVACDAGCLMQIAGGLSRVGSRVKALHLAQVLAGADGQ